MRSSSSGRSCSLRRPEPRFSARLPRRLPSTRERFARLALDVLGQAERTGQRVELAELLLVLEAQLLLVVGALGLGDEDLALPKLQLQPQPLVRRTQILALLLELRDALHRNFALLARAFALGGQLRL